MLRITSRMHPLGCLDALPPLLQRLFNFLLLALHVAELMLHIDDLLLEHSQFMSIGWHILFYR